MTYITDLSDARDNIAARLKAITANPKPSYSIDGQSVEWTAYQRMLLDTLRTLNAAIAESEGPDEEMTEIYTGIHPRG